MFWKDGDKAMMIIGLTGGIGMGKSTAARIMRGFGFPVHDADAVVHDLLAPNGAAADQVAELFPDAVRHYWDGRGVIKRRVLAKIVYENPDSLKKLESVLHPLVREAEREFFEEAQRKKARAVVLDIPLLYETGAEARCDVVLCMSAPEAVRRARVMKRADMTQEKLEAILARQLPEAEKKRRADYVIPSGKGMSAMRKALKEALIEIGIL
ncbi:MAG: dephospho-CoA kinase [Bdellovibrionales bacterium]